MLVCWCHQIRLSIPTVPFQYHSTGSRPGVALGVCLVMAMKIIQDIHPCSGSGGGAIARKVCTAAVKSAFLRLVVYNGRWT